MGRETIGKSLLQGWLGKVFNRDAATKAGAPPNAVLAMLERLYGGESPDYCLYLRPPGAGMAVAKGILAIDLEDLMVKAFDPLPVVALDETSDGHRLQALPDEAFLLLANRARVLLLAPTDDARFIQRLGLIKSTGPLSRGIFLMPDAASLGSADWPALWPGACSAAAALGLEFSGYTAGGWLFRIDKAGKSCTFRPIVNPNPEKIAKALEAICAEMT